MNAVPQLVAGTCEQHGAFTGRCAPCREMKLAQLDAEREAAERAQRIRGLLRAADLPERFDDKGFGDYTPRTPKQEKALRACLDYAEHLEQRVASGTCLALIGNVGVGKTHLLASIARTACRRGISARYITAEGMTSAWGFDGEDRALFVNPRLLVLDEVGVPATAPAASALIAMLDERYRCRRPTLVASNLTWEEMKTNVGERFCDRLLEGGGRVLIVDGKSARGPA